ncbi:MAG TPA: PhnD/SsuA/transferrin family substrate-binding protein [Steroidobacteraceae bacterium]|jgi:ABC-type phosphate/phosphonate transport system substrate-binding protein|nr:PhnD/SsuA/transferrin family substrate-binding protein [Steroidobacteraceae bacterium]
MIANARMYSVSPQAAELWRRLLAAVIVHAGLDIELLEHAEPAPINELWQRSDKAAVFMCGLPFSLSHPRPELIAAPVPSPPDFHGMPQYWSEMVVRNDSAFHAVEDTFGARIALTVPDSQSGCLAALYYLMTSANQFPVYREVITPQVTPQGAMSAVIAGAADVAPIDSYAFCLLRKYRPDLTSQLRTIGRTERTPIPALVASRTGLGGLQDAFLEAHRIESVAPLMAALLLQRFVRPDPESYDALRLNFEAASRFWSEHPLASTVHPAFAAGPFATPGLREESGNR